MYVLVKCGCTCSYLNISITPVTLVSSIFFPEIEDLLFSIRHQYVMFKKWTSTWELGQQRTAGSYSQEHTKATAVAIHKLTATVLSSVCEHIVLCSHTVLIHMKYENIFHKYSSALSITFPQHISSHYGIWNGQRTFFATYTWDSILQFSITSNT